MQVAGPSLLVPALSPSSSLASAFVCAANCRCYAASCLLLLLQYATTAAAAAAAAASAALLLLCYSAVAAAVAAAALLLLLLLLSLPNLYAVFRMSLNCLV